MTDTSAAAHPDRRDLVILGGGLVGMTCALAAAKMGITSHVVDKADPAEFDALEPVQRLREWG